jgi:hypothetical protein
MKLSTFKFKNLLILLKSKLLKKKINKENNKIKNDFINYIKEKNFSEKWFLNNFNIFHYFLPSDLDKKFSYLEIGSFEGLSALNILYHYKNAKVTAIDLWGDCNTNSEPLKVDFKEIEKKFDKNLENYNFIKIKKDSVIALREILRTKISFDMIYIDGSHNGEDILSDAIESYKLLSSDGLIIFDDISNYNKDITVQAYEGFQKFCEIHKNKIKIQYLGNIAIVKKI